MPRTLLVLIAAAALVLPASALADPGVVERASQGPAGGNGDFSVDQGGLSDDGRCVVFETSEKLVDEDPNTRGDIYERCGSTTILVSIGPAAGAGTAPSPFLAYRDMSADGGCVNFNTNEKLTDDDGDTKIDIYKRCGGTIERVSQGPEGGDAAQDVANGNISADGLCVVFSAHEALTSDDHDTIPDLFERCGSTTKRVTQGPVGGDATDVGANFEAITADGGCVLFTTQEVLTGDDHDSSRDAYTRCGSTTTKVTPGDGAFDVHPGLLSPDGQCLVFETGEALAATDTDSENDVYTRCGSSLLHVTVGPAGGNAEIYTSASDISRDGSCVVFDTEEKITADDTDTTVDAYKRCGAAIERVSTGAGGGNAEIDAETDYISPDGRCVVFTSAEHVTADDTDASDDLFERCGDSTERVARGPSGGNGSFAPSARAISTDGTRVIFTTDEQLTADDTNAVTDIYERSNGQTTKVSPAQQSVNPYGSNEQGVSADASRVLFSRFDRLASDDTDDRFDIYLATLAPTAATGAPTDVTTTGATLNGTSSGDPAAKYHFELSGQSTAEGDVPVGAGIKRVSTSVSGLTPDTTYSYRLVVTSAGGTTTSVERTFKTLPPPVAEGPGDSGNDGGTGGGGDQGTPPPPESFAGVAISGGTVKVKRGLATLKVSCPSAARDACTGKLTLKAGRRTIGSKAFSIKPGKTAKVSVRISRTGKKLLAKRRALKASATAVARDARGTAVKTPAKKLTLKRR